MSIESHVSVAQFWTKKVKNFLTQHAKTSDRASVREPEPEPEPEPFFEKV